MPRLLRFIIRKEASSSPIFGGTECRVSSPFGDFSILMTSAPMSASIRVQVGPAMTWVRSTTFRPASGPVRGALLFSGMGAPIRHANAARAC